MKTCRFCGIDLPLEAFSRNATRKDGLSIECIDCRDHMVSHRISRSVVREAGTPIVRRTSPYVQMALVLDDIEKVANDPDAVRAIIEEARVRFHLERVA